jgi:hypothetical protein
MDWKRRYLIWRWKRNFLISCDHRNKLRDLKDAMYRDMAELKRLYPNMIFDERRLQNLAIHHVSGE